MLEHSENIVDQPGEFKLKESINAEEINQFLIKRKKDVEERMNGKSINDFYKIGIVVKIRNDNNLYQIISRFDYSEDKIMFDYKGIKYNDSNSETIYFNHQEIEKAFKVDLNEEIGGKKR